MDDRTLIGPASGGANPNATAQLDRTQTIGGNATVDFDQKTQMGIALQCPVCETQNAPGETWCGECGFRLDATPGEAVSPALTTLPAQLTDAQGVVFPLRFGVNSVGRQNTDVLLADTSVSRRHAEIEVERGEVWLEDLGSSNGTLLNGERLSSGDPRQVANGAEIRIGSAKFTFQMNPLPGEAENENADSVETASSGERTVGLGNVMLLGTPPEDVDASGESPSNAAEPNGPHLLLPSGEAFNLPEGTTTVGRRAGNGLVLPDPHTSGFHAEFQREGEAVTLVDQGSTNGTQRNGERLAPHEPVTLQEGDTLIFGQAQVVFRNPEPSPGPSESFDASDTQAEEVSPTPESLVSGPSSGGS